MVGTKKISLRRIGKGTIVVVDHTTMIGRGKTHHLESRIFAGGKKIGITVVHQHRRGNKADIFIGAGKIGIDAQTIHHRIHNDADFGLTAASMTINHRIGKPIQTIKIAIGKITHVAIPQIG